MTYAEYKKLISEKENLEKNGDHTPFSFEQLFSQTRTQTADEKKIDEIDAAIREYEKENPIKIYGDDHETEIDRVKNEKEANQKYGDNVWYLYDTRLHCYRPEWNME